MRKTILFTVMVLGISASGAMYAMESKVAEEAETRMMINAQTPRGTQLLAEDWTSRGRPLQGFRLNPDLVKAGSFHEGYKDLKWDDTKKVFTCKNDKDELVTLEPIYEEGPDIGQRIARFLDNLNWKYHVAAATPLYIAFFYVAYQRYQGF